MRLTLARIAAALLVPTLTAFAAVTGAVDDAATSRGSSLPFGVGEQITYKIRYGGVTGGTARRTILPMAEVQGRAAYHILSESRSNKTFDAIRQIREHNESWMDAKTLSSLRFLEDVRNGPYRKNSETTFDPATRSLKHTYQTTKHSGETEEAAPDGVQDAISVIYFLRTKPLSVGDEYDIPFHTGGKLQNAKVHVKADETVKVPAGKFECLHLEPTLENQKGKEIELEVWMTKDERRIPVLIKSRLSFGSFVAEMTKFSPATSQ